MTSLKLSDIASWQDQAIEIDRFIMREVGGTKWSHLFSTNRAIACYDQMQMGPYTKWKKLDEVNVSV